MRGAAPEPSDLKTRDEIRREAWASLVYQEYCLVRDGIASYADLGHDDGLGRPIEYKLLEYLVIGEIESRKIRMRRKNGRRA